MKKLLPYPQNKVILEELWLLLGFNSGTELREELKDELSNEKVDLKEKFKGDPIALNKALTTYLKGTGDSSVNGWFNGTSQPNYQPFSIAIKRVFNASNRDCTIKNESDLEPYIKAITDKKKAKNSRYIVKNSIPPKVQINIPYTNNQLFGREDELTMLDKAWGENQSNIIALKAFGGTGKTALMKRWLNDLALDNFREADKVYAVSFYSQGAAEGKQASADEFFDTALKWFNYQGDLLSSARDKGLKLAELVNQQRTLLVLDGLEPVQYPETAVMDGALRDAGLKALFEQLAMHNKGLLLISSRQGITELNDKPAPLVIQHMLDPLSVPAGIELFKTIKLKGSDQEFADAIYEVNGHALSLNLLAKYLITYEDGDIRQRTNLPALTDFPEETRDTRHALKVMAAYEKQLEGTTELQVLYMMGLFDRPVSAEAIQCLRDITIENISDTKMNNKIFKAVTGRLRDQNLLNKENPDHPSILDTHPLVREYFGRRLKQQYPDAYQLAHKTLYIFYKELPVKELPDTLNEMEPLFAVVAHGCASGLHQEALVEVYWPRIRRKKEMYLCIKLGSFGSELAIVSHFF